MKRKAKRREAYICSECGSQAAAHEGRCHRCGKFGTMQKEAVEKGPAILPPEAQATVEVLLENLRGLSRKDVTQTVALLVRPKSEGGVGLDAQGLAEIAQEALDEHQRQPKDRPLGFMVAIAKRGRKPSRFPTHDEVVDSWKPLAELGKQMLADLPALAAAGKPEGVGSDAPIQFQAQPAAAKDDCELCGGSGVVQAWRLERGLIPCPRCACPTCGGSHLVLDRPGGALVACPECNQEWPEQRRARFLRLSGIEGAMAVMTLAAVELVPSVADAVEAVRLLVASEISQLVLIGGPGRGKTHMAVAAMIECIDRGMSGLYLNTARFLDELRGTYSPEAPMDFEDKMRPALTWDLCVLDDLAGERRTDWAQEKLFEIVDTRYGRQLRTIACSNQAMRTWDPRVASRLSDRRRGLVVTLLGEDYRLRPNPAK